MELVRYTYIHLHVLYFTLHIDTYILLMTPKYTSLTSKFSIFVGVRVNQRLQGEFR